MAMDSRFATGSMSTTMRVRWYAWLRLALPGETYNIGGWNEARNLDVVHNICDLLDELAPDHRDGITCPVTVS